MAAFPRAGFIKTNEQYPGAPDYDAAFKCSMWNYNYYDISSDCINNSSSSILGPSVKELNNSSLSIKPPTIGSALSSLKVWEEDPNRYSSIGYSASGAELPEKIRTCIKEIDSRDAMTGEATYSWTVAGSDDFFETDLNNVITATNVKTLEDVYKNYKHWKYSGGIYFAETQFLHINRILKSLRVTGDVVFNIILLNHISVTSVKIMHPDTVPGGSASINFWSFYSFLEWFTGNLYYKELDAGHGLKRIPSPSMFSPTEFTNSDSKSIYINDLFPQSNFIKSGNNANYLRGILQSFGHEHLNEFPYIVCHNEKISYDGTTGTIFAINYDNPKHGGDIFNFSSCQGKIIGIHFFQWKSRFDMKKIRTAQDFCLAFNDQTLVEIEQCIFENFVTNIYVAGTTAVAKVSNCLFLGETALFNNIQSFRNFLFSNTTTGYGGIGYRSRIACWSQLGGTLEVKGAGNIFTTSHEDFIELDHILKNSGGVIGNGTENSKLTYFSYTNPSLTLIKGWTNVLNQAFQSKYIIPGCNFGPNPITQFLFESGNGFPHRHDMITLSDNYDILFRANATSLNFNVGGKYSWWREYYDKNGNIISSSCEWPNLETEVSSNAKIGGKAKNGGESLILFNPPTTLWPASISPAFINGSDSQIDYLGQNSNIFYGVSFLIPTHYYGDTLNPRVTLFSAIPNGGADPSSCKLPGFSSTYTMPNAKVLNTDTTLWNIITGFASDFQTLTTKYSLYPTQVNFNAFTNGSSTKIHWKNDGVWDYVSLNNNDNVFRRGREST
jgi:hypothetical protein